MGGRRALRHIGSVAATQRGLVTREQLLGAGVTRRSLDGLVARGWLERVHTGVYAIGPPRDDPITRCLAATLATGGVLSHRSAAEHWGLLRPHPGPVHVTRATRDGSRLRTIVVHESALRRDEIVPRAGVPCTSLVRTLCDLAGVVDRRTLARAFEQAQVLHRLQPAILAATLLERPGRRGVRALHELLLDAVDPGEIESVLELRFLAFCAKYGLPRPRTQVDFGIWRVDFVFADEGVVVETDGRRFHATAAARVRDARKTADLEARGLVVVRVTWRELHDTPAALAVRLRALLDAPSRASSPGRGENARLDS